MPARTPEELHRVFAEALNAHDLEALMALFEPEANLIPQPGQVVTGTEAIREALSGCPRPQAEVRPRIQESLPGRRHRAIVL